MAKFITFEGGEGSGKSTQSKLLHKYLNENNISSVWTREIGGTIVAEDIRRIVVDFDLLAKSELLLVMAARYEHINKVILPALMSNKWVICDRFVDSSAAYQAVLSGFSISEIYKLHDDIMKITNDYDNDGFFAKYASCRKMLENLEEQKFDKYSNLKDEFLKSALMPDITFLLNIDPVYALNRSINSGEVNKFEKKNIDFHKNVYSNFNLISKKYPNRVVKIECKNSDIDTIHNEILSIMKSKNFL